MMNILRFFFITTLFYSCTAFHNPFQAGTFNALLSETDYSIAVIVNPPPALTNQTSFEISIAGDGVTHYKYSINSTEYSEIFPVSQPVVLSSLVDGSYQLRVIGCNSSYTWQSEENATQVSWVIDSNMVFIGLINTPQKITNNTSIKITVSGDDVTAYKYKLDENAWSSEIPIIETIQYEKLADGSHTIYVCGKKNNDLWQADEESIQYQWIVDTTPPIVTVTDKKSASGKPSLDGTIDDSDAVITLKINDVTYDVSNEQNGFWKIESGVIQTELANGTYPIEVIAVDKALNSSVATGSLEINTNLILAVLENTPQKFTDRTSINITVSGVYIVSYKFKLDENTWSSEILIATTIQFDTLATGNHTISVVGKKNDDKWQEDADATLFKWNINTVPVVAVLSGEPSLFTKSKTCDISVSGTNVVYYKYKVDADAYSIELPITNKISLTGLTDKKYTISVLGANENRIWQKMEVPTVYSWTVDTVAPVITANTKTTSVTSPDLSGTVNDQSATIQLSINGLNYTGKNNISGVWILDAGTIAGLSNGTYGFTVSAIDLAGNTGNGTGTVKIDTTVPTVILSDLPASITNIDSIAITAGGPDIVSYKYKINDGAWSDFIPVSTKIVKSSLIGGNYTIYACGKKAVGTEQLEQNATSSTWTIDKILPVITLVGESVVYLNKGDVYTSPVDSATVTDNSGEIISAVKSGAIDIDTTISGVYLETYSATDSAGNQAISVSRKIVVYKPFDGSSLFTDEDNKIESSTAGKTIYLDYDDQFIYIGLKGEEMNLVNKVLYFALNSEESGTVGSTIINEVIWYEGRQVNLPFKAKYLYMAKHYINTKPGEQANLTQKYKRISDGTAWGGMEEIKEPNINEFRLYTSDNTTKTSLYAINRTNIGNPQGKISFVVYVKNLESDDKGYGWMFSSAPANGIDGIGPRTFTKYFELDLNSTAKPNVAAVVITQP